MEMAQKHSASYAMAKPINAAVPHPLSHADDLEIAAKKGDTVSAATTSASLCFFFGVKLGRRCV